jgi:hypothetical protein
VLHVLECRDQRVPSSPYGRDGRISSVLGSEARLFCRAPRGLRGFAQRLLSTAFAYLPCSLGNAATLFGFASGGFGGETIAFGEVTLPLGIPAARFAVLAPVLGWQAAWFHADVVSGYDEYSRRQQNVRASCGRAPAPPSGDIQPGRVVWHSRLEQRLVHDAGLLLTSTRVRVEMM